MIGLTVRRPSSFSTPVAFTLVEVLVATSVLVLLILVVSQLVQSATRLITGNHQHIDADDQARLMLDRMALDFGRMLKRQDVDYIFASQTGNDACFFYSEAPAYFDGSQSTPSAESPLSLIGYRVSSSNPIQLSRLGKGLTWDESAGSAPGALVFLTPAATPSASPTPSPALASTLAGHWATTIGTASGGYNDGVDSSYHVLGDQVCRMEICFLLNPVPASGATAAQPARYSIVPYWGTPAHSAVNGLQDVQAVVVALAVLDASSRRIAPDLSHMATALRDINANDLSSSPPALPAKIWQDEIDQNKLAGDARIPQAAAAQVRIYQRHFYLGNR